MMFQSVTEKPTKKQEGNLKFQWEINRRNEKMKKGKYECKTASGTMILVNLHTSCLARSLPKH
jgi:hypothetical protein